MKEITTDDIPKFEKLLKLGYEYDETKLLRNYLKLAKYYHPRFKRGTTEDFKNVILAYEVLTYLLKNKDSYKDRLVTEWNFSQKNKMENKIQHLTSLSFREFIAEVHDNPPGFKPFKIIFGVLISIVTFLMFIIFIAQFVFGIVYPIIINISIVLLLFSSLVMLIRTFKK